MNMYLAANEGRLESIKYAISYHIEGMDPLVAIQPYEAATPEITNSPVTLDDVTHAYGIEGDEALSAVETINQQYQMMTRQDALDFQIAITAIRLIDYRAQYPDSDPTRPPWRRNGHPAGMLVPYASARIAIVQSFADNGNAIDLNHIQLLDPKGDNVAEKHGFKISDELLTQRFSVHSIEKVIRYVSYDIRPTEDELLRRCVEVLDHEYIEQRLIPILSGIVDEPTIYATLRTLQEQYQGTPAEGAVWSLLHDLEQRALTVREAREQERRLGPGIHLPSADKLHELEEYLGID